ncbi:alpha-galactosidase [Kitasatospora sp. NBC_00070]|uniref:glycoside hydrolase family 36 protein n=1 Tax=Kitasatospora sp. NBC_00070 TaxID=2975962 RepID=UPI003249A727
MLSVTTAELAPAEVRPLLDEIGIAVLGDGARWELTHESDEVSLLTLRGDGELEIRLSVPLGDAAGFWHPECHWERTIVADWGGRATASLVDGTIAGCLYGAAGQTRLTFVTLDHLPGGRMLFGVSEEHKTYVVHLHVDPGARPYRLLLARTAPTVATAMRRLRERIRRDVTLPPLPPGGDGPAYSTWYAFSQHVAAAPVEAEAALAAELGCGVLLLDDGWQEHGSGRGYAGVGDWLPDTAKFPDLRAHVAAVQALGLKYLLWVAPLLLGPRSAAFGTLAGSAPLAAPAPGAHVLDPRLPAVRDHVVRTGVRLVTDYGLDGLKFDFLNDVMVYAGTPPTPGADTADVGAAMGLLLDELRTALEAVRPGVLIELRQPYAGPAMAPYGNLFRADDCPADAVDNRVRTIDISLLGVGGAVHSDMLMWDPLSTPQIAARQLIAVLHAVPQLSARLADLSAEHRRMLTFWLGQWRRLQPTLTGGALEPGRPDGLYQLITAVRDDECVVIVHEDRVVGLPRAARTTVVNGGTADRVVIELTGPGRDFRHRTFDACGDLVASGPVRLGSGLTALAVPPSGLAVLDEVTA